MFTKPRVFLILPVLLHLTNAIPGLGARDSQIDLSTWALQLPIGKPGHPTTITGSKLKAGYSHPDYFYTGSNGELTMVVDPGKSCIKTANSKHCRTELREESPASWDPNAAKNRLIVSLAVKAADDSTHGTVIGQIHIDDSVSVRPVCELYYNSEGKLSFGVEQTREGGNQIVKELGVTVPLGTKFSYEIHYENNKLSVSINGKVEVFGTYQLDAPKSYFKVGNYNQGSSRSEVDFYTIQMVHQGA
jgi:hypothetical protein